MIDICLLGTSGMMPLKSRYLTSLMFRYNGHSFLIDCGEATQISIQKQEWSVKDIDVLMITHFHADHISGLPGLLLAMSNAEKTEPLTIIGPKGIEKVVNSLRIIVPVLNFEIKFIELTDELETFSLFGMSIYTFRVNHKISCYGYSFRINRLPKFDPEKAKELQIPVQYWRDIQTGIYDESCPFWSSMNMLELRDKIMGPERAGIKFTYVTDSRPTKQIMHFAENTDLFICEGMYGDETEIENAKSKKHMLMTEAADIASKVNAKQLWLTHYSPSVHDPLVYKDKVTKIFKNTVFSKDRQTITLNFEN